MWRFDHSRQVIFRDLAILGKSSSGIRPISASHLPNLLDWEERCDWVLNCLAGGMNNAVNSLWLDKAIPVIWFYAPLVRFFHKNLKKNLLCLWFIIYTGSNEPSQVARPPNSNGRTIPSSSKTNRAEFRLKIAEITCWDLEKITCSVRK